MNAVDHNHEHDRDEATGALLRDAAGTFRPTDEIRRTARQRIMEAVQWSEERAKPQAASESQSQRRRLRRWRWPWPAAGAAAALAAAAIIALVLWPSPLTLAQVREAVDAAEWVHVTYETGEEEWYAPRRGIRAVRELLDGHWSYWDRANGILQYTGNFDWIGQRPIDSAEPAGSAWDLIVKPLEQQSEGRTVVDYEDVERHEEVVDGRPLVRFDTYFTDPLGNHLLIQQLWADPDTRLPVRVRERLHADTLRFLRARGQYPDSEFIVGVYDFPESGPESIYDLGISRDLPIIRSERPELSQPVAGLLEAGKDALLRFPSHYRIVGWTADGASSELTHWSGPVGLSPHRLGGYTYDLDDVRYRIEWYHSMKPADRDFDPDYYLPPTESADEALTWMESLPPVALYMRDGEMNYRRGGAAFHVKTFNASHQPLEIGRGRGMWSCNCWPIRNQWQYAKRVAGPPVILPPSEEAPPGTIGLRWTWGDRLTDYYIDPKHDFICVRQIFWKEGAEGSWRRERQTDLADLVQLPGDQWVAMRMQQFYASDEERNRAEVRITWLMEISVLNEHAFPPLVFDGQKLIEEAKAQGVEIETY